MIKGILFDFDGTIVDSEKSRLESINATLDPFKTKITQTEWDKKYKKLNTKPIFDEITKRHKIQENTQTLYEKSHKLREQLIQKNGIDTIKGFEEFHKFLIQNKIKMLICSGGKKEFIKLLLQKINLKMDFISREDYKNTKPQPDAYIKGLQILDLKKDEIIVFDDSYNGLLSAKNGNFKTIIAINNTTAKDKISKLNLTKNIKDYTELDFQKILNI